MSDDQFFRTRHENGKVIVIFNGKGIPVPWEVADQIARAITSKARIAEEYCKANRIIADNALLARSGVLPGVGLSSHPVIQDETIKAALHDRDLRRRLPYQQNADSIGAIKSRGVVGTPSISKVASHGNVRRLEGNSKEKHGDQAA